MSEELSPLISSAGKQECTAHYLHLGNPARHALDRIICSKSHIIPESVPCHIQDTLSIGSLCGMRKQKVSEAKLMPTISSPESTHPHRLKRSFREFLKKNGYTSLEFTLQHQEGKVWDEIRELESPMLMEQLIHLYTLGKERALKEYSLEKFMLFCLRIAHRLPSDSPLSAPRQELETITENHAILGKVLYLANLDIERTLNLLNCDELEKSIQAIKSVFKKQLQTVQDSINKHVQQHIRAGLNEDRQAHATRLSLELAGALITDHGAFNVGIIRDLRKKFIPEYGKLLPFQTDIIHVLQTMEESPHLRAILSSIQKPVDEAGPAAQVIRINLGLAAHVSPTDTDAKITALSALLSHMRQGKSASCFASYVGIGMLSLHLEKCLCDFKELLHTSKLTRRINGHIVEFPFLLRSNHESLCSPICIGNDGQVKDYPGSNFCVWNIPGIQIACLTIGIKDCQGCVMHALSGLFKEKDGGKIILEIQITLKELLKRMVQVAKYQQPELTKTAPRLLDKAILAFSAQTHNILLRMWENTLAGMAEARSCSKIKNALMTCLLKTLRKKLDMMILPDKEWVWPSLLKEVSNLTARRVQLMFDPCVIRNKKRLNGTILHGAFVLYDRSDPLLPIVEQRCDNNAAFQRFVASILQHAGKSVEKQLIGTDPAHYREHLQNLQEYIASDHFTKAILVRFHPSNKNDTNILQHLDEVTHAPWLNQSGNSSKELLSAYLELSSAAHLTPNSVTAANAKELLAEIIAIGKKLPDHLQESLAQSPHKRFPMILNRIHALSLLLGHPTLAKGWKAAENAPNWIEKVMAPGLAISHGPITQETKNLLFDHVRTEYIAVKNHPAFDKNVKELAEQSMSVLQFCLILRNIVIGMSDKIKWKADEISEGIDTFLCLEALPEKSRNALRNSAVHFSDTNWNQGVHDLHFCFIVNPGSGDLELWRIMENGTGLLALNQAKWVKGTKWDIFIERQKAK